MSEFFFSLGNCLGKNPEEERSQNEIINRGPSSLRNKIFELKELKKMLEIENSELKKNMYINSNPQKDTESYFGGNIRNKIREEVSKNAELANQLKKVKDEINKKTLEFELVSKRLGNEKEKLKNLKQMLKNHSIEELQAEELERLRLEIKVVRNKHKKLKQAIEEKHHQIAILQPKYLEVENLRNSILTSQVFKNT